MSQDVREYINKCRFCLLNLNNNMSLELHEYFEELFHEITGIRVNYFHCFFSAININFLFVLAYSVWKFIYKSMFSVQ